MDTTQASKEIAEYEKDLPLPYAFRKLVSLYRTLGKKCKQSGDNQGALLYFDKMLSLSKLWHSFYGHKTSGIEGREVDRAEKSLEQFLAKHHNLYPFTFQKEGAIPNDVLLSATDYKNLQVLTDLANQNVDIKKLYVKQKRLLLKKSLRLVTPMSTGFQ